MSSNQHCWSLGSLLLLLAGTNLGVLVTIPQKLVNGTVGQSVLLPVSYRFNSTPRFPLSVVWTSMNRPDPLISCTVMNCTLGAGEVPHSCSYKCIPPTTYRGHVEFFPESGSLLLQGLRLSDSGTYTVTFRPSHRVWMVNLTVHEQPPSPRHPGPTDPNHSRYYIIGICSSVSLLLLLLLSCCIWRRGAAWQQKRRHIKVQQVSSVEEAPMESAVVTDVATIYTTVGGSFQQAPPRPATEVVYASVNSPRLAGRDPRPYHLLV